jgi:hypothetical protein
MKKKSYILILALVLLFAVLFVPIPTQDGGTKAYTALTYKVVQWNRLVGKRLYSARRIYAFPNNFRSLEDLWSEESLSGAMADKTNSFVGIVLRLENGVAMVRPAFCETQYRISDLISFSLEGLPEIDAQFRSSVKIVYTGEIMESYPAQIHAVHWEPDNSLRTRKYGDGWLSEQAVPYAHNITDATVIVSEIYEDCFFVGSVTNSSVVSKINGQLDAQWQVGDYAAITCENAYYDESAGQLEADLISICHTDWQPNPNNPPSYG